MERETVGMGAWLGRLTGRSNPKIDAASWEVSVQLDLSAEVSDVEWAISGLANDRPAEAEPVGDGEAPWETAVRMLRELRPGEPTPAVALIRAQVAAARPALNLIFAPA